MDNTLEKAILKVIDEKTKEQWEFDQPMTRRDFVEILHKACEIRDLRGINS